MTKVEFFYIKQEMGTFSCIPEKQSDKPCGSDKLGNRQTLRHYLWRQYAISDVTVLTLYASSSETRSNSNFLQ